MHIRWNFICLFLCLSTGCSVLENHFQRSDSEQIKLGRNTGAKLHIYHREVAGYSIRVQVAGDSNLPVLLLIHGAPGSVATFNGLLKDSSITRHFRLVAADRPGYGGSDAGFSETSIFRQAVIIRKAVSPWLPDTGYNVLGRSYGGPVAATIAGLDAQKVKNLFLVSASMQPGAEKIYGISYLIRLPFLDRFFPRVIRVSNDEKLAHRESLLEAIPVWKKIRANLYILHGTDDHLIYTSNAGFAAQTLDCAASIHTEIQTGNHFVFLQNDASLLRNFLIHVFLP